jgi:hypothetical protein
MEAIRCIPPMVTVGTRIFNRLAVRILEISRELTTDARFVEISIYRRNRR